MNARYGSSFEGRRGRRRSRRPGLAQHPLDGGVMDAELPGDGPHAPVLDEVVAQDLRLELVTERHRVRRSVPRAGAPTYRRAPPVKANKPADRAFAEVAVHRGGRFGGHRRARLVHRNSMTRQCSTTGG